MQGPSQGLIVETLLEEAEKEICPMPSGWQMPMLVITDAGISQSPFKAFFLSITHRTIGNQSSSWEEQWAVHG